MIKSPKETRNRKNVPQQNKGCMCQTYRQHCTKQRKLKVFPLKSGTRQGWPLLFNVLPEFLAKAVQQEKEIRGMQREKKPIYLYWRWYDPILKRPYRIHQKTLKSDKTFSKIVGNKINI
jgi:hypothetical protein